MDYVMVSLRIVHIVAGVFWAGSAFFLALILEPRLRVLGPAIQRPVMGPALGTSAIITMSAGIWLALRLRWGHLDKFFSSEWGYAILVGFVASLLAFSTGVASGVISAKMANLGRAIEGRPPSPEEGAQLQLLAGRLTRLTRAMAVLVFIAVGSMASARFL